jgi:hypothetical protein
VARGIVWSIGAYQDSVPGDPAAIRIVGGNVKTAIVGKSLATRLRVLVTDVFGNPVAGAVVTFMAPTQGPGGTFGGKTTVSVITSANGVAAASFTANTQAGAFTVTAATPGVAAPVSFRVTNVPGAPAQVLTVVGTPQSATVNQPYTTAFKVKVTDSLGNPLSGVTVTFLAPASGPSGSFAGSTTVSTDTTGLATAPAFTANTKAGSFTVTASVHSVGSALFKLTNVAASAAKITPVAGTPQSTKVGTNFTTALVAQVTDSFNNPISGLLVTFTIHPDAGTGASGTFNGNLTATATTTATGKATAPLIKANAKPGSFSVTATVSGVVTSATFDLTNNA